MKYQAFKQIAENRMTEILNSHGVFFAFSDKQFHENKTPLADGEKYVSIGAGGYMPKSKAKAFGEALTAHNKWKRKAVRAKVDIQSVIEYELANYETGYTGDPSDAIQALADIGITEKEVRAILPQYMQTSNA